EPRQAVPALGVRARSAAGVSRPRPPSVLAAIAPEQRRRRHAPARSRVHDPDLEAVSLQAEVPLDPIDQPLDGRVLTDRPATPGLAVRAFATLLDPTLVGVAHQPLEGPPVHFLQALQSLSLRHRDLLGRPALRSAAPSPR